MILSLGINSIIADITHVRHFDLFFTSKVDIFFRRALFQRESDPTERLFCLMNADKLQYDVSEQSLKDVTEYIKSAKKGEVLYSILLQISYYVYWRYVSENKSLVHEKMYITMPSIKMSDSDWMKIDENNSKTRA